MHQTPKTFVAICGMADIEPAQAQEKWLDLWEKTVREFLTWLIKESNLGQKQLQDLEKILKDVKADVKGKDPLFDTILSLLKPAQQTEAVEKYSQLFVDHLDDFYHDLENNFSLDQKQVLNAYLNSHQNA
ncbi:hypothetical protein A2160_04420 [Candidatus Beckwithbacteria bacterium RBG_13_42_9]|uniref:Uncharacterized protein n=1 Tax=Candidatus Beckwithbacteria bacterium RBG_13_42_9 TaxID=1797457 RepID=A0A1F5E6J3_9BACT|nr:MAG: hypothetical protein A2160_04420 [Candidatus Beckwithbacteria bacterium RBG_13_42_9]